MTFCAVAPEGKNAHNEGGRPSRVLDTVFLDSVGYQAPLHRLGDICNLPSCCRQMHRSHDVVVVIRRRKPLDLVQSLPPYNVAGSRTFMISLLALL